MNVTNVTHVTNVHNVNNDTHVHNVKNDTHVKNTIKTSKTPDFTIGSLAVIF